MPYLYFSVNWFAPHCTDINDKTFDNYFYELHYQPNSHWNDKLVAGESADTVLVCGSLCLLDNNDSAGQWDPEKWALWGGMSEEETDCFHAL